MDARALVTSAIAATEARSRPALEALWVGARLRAGDGDPAELLGSVPASLQALSLGYVARAGRAPGAALAAEARAIVRRWRGERGALSDDEAALGLWAGLAPGEVGMGQVRPGLAALDQYSLARRMLAWGVPATFGEAARWIDAHLTGRAWDAGIATAVQLRRPRVEEAVALVARVGDPVLRFDAAVYLAIPPPAPSALPPAPALEGPGGIGTFGAASEQVVSLGCAAFDALEARAREQPTLRAKRAALVAGVAPDEARAALVPLVIARGTPLVWLGASAETAPRWGAIAAARCGFEVWRPWVEACIEARGNYALGERREALLVDVLAAARHLPDLEARRDAVLGVFRDALPRWRGPLWRALAWCEAIALGGGAGVGPMVNEALARLREARGHAALGAHLPDLVRALAPHAPERLSEVLGMIGDPGLRALGAMMLYEELGGDRRADAVV
ncbi:MAG: hypothetical protein IT385_27350 [Deltaproteobacteria bacterium]|nr:hypothetical protein [Deltaproteobacteria bacterium]